MGLSFAVERAGEAGLEEAADEFGLTVGFSFREDVLCMGARRRLGDLQPRGGREKTLAANNFAENAGFAVGEPEFGGKAPDLRGKIGGGIHDEEGGRGTVNVEDYRSIGGEREDMGNERRPSPAARQFKASPHFAAALTGPRAAARERTQALGQSRSRSREPPILMAQANSTPHEILRFGVGEKDTAILRQKENGETGGRDRRAERIRRRPRLRKKMTDLGCPL